MFIRSPLNPIIKPDGKIDWASRKTYNPAVFYKDYFFTLFFRAVDDSGISRIGLAYSGDGENFITHKMPVITPSLDTDIAGTEDPRMAKVDEQFFMTYTGYDNEVARLHLATSFDLKNWTKHGPILKDWNLLKAGGFNVPTDIARAKNPTDWSKAGAIFPEKINNKFVMLFGDSNIWLASSDDGIDWAPDNKPLLSTRKQDFFDSYHLEMGPPPIKTELGWLVLYHGVDEDLVYQLGFCLLDLNNPAKIIYRHAEPIFSPREDYETDGIIDITKNDRPKVIFCCGACIVDDSLRIYYGAGDKYICTAAVSAKDVLELCRT